MATPFSSTFSSPATLSPTSFASLFTTESISSFNLSSPTPLATTNFLDSSLTFITTFPSLSSTETTLPVVTITSSATAISWPPTTTLSPTTIHITPTASSTSSSGAQTHFRTAAVIVVFSILGLIVLGIVATVTTIIRKHLRVQRKLRRDAEEASAPMLSGASPPGMSEVGGGPYGR
ncbi:hypothetical protein BDZ94DRAFT_1270242 [Collybia nuda]|uniref:Transmembrane protein n=1 Tax=Collybia nuda TaxID=64659 RepID=A0A9P5XVZ0_9AGAR|nr:hypothetical protein BDZ94DRAFT_1270242 [Collybia nuda]